MFVLDYNDRRPAYEQIKENIKKLIVSGAMQEGEALPSVRELAGRLGINPNTIQRAYKELEAEGFICSMRARGSVVAPRANTILPRRKEELFLQMEAVLTELSFGGVAREEVEAFLDQYYDGRTKA